MSRSSIVVTAFAGAAVLSFAQFAAAAPTQSRIDYPAAMDPASIAYKDARASCDSLAGHGKDMCVKQARATQVKLVAEAKADKTAIHVRTDAREETREAQYKVAIARCDALAGPEKEACTSSAKSAHGNSERRQVICT